MKSTRSELAPSYCSSGVESKALSFYGSLFVVELCRSFLHCIVRLSVCRLFRLPRHLTIIILLQEDFVVLEKRTPEQRELL
jgi:hypothetical protein